MTLKKTNQKLDGYCQFEEVINILKNKWVILIIRDLILGRKYFTEFKEDKPNLSNKVLSQRLKELEKKGIIRKEEKETTEYFLTEKGNALRNILYEMSVFNLKYQNYSNQEIEEIKKELILLKDFNQD